MGSAVEIESPNYAKFQTSNPVVRRLIDRFYATLGSVVSTLEYESLLDAGCGEGETIARLAGRLPDRVAGVDIRADCVAYTGRRFPGMEVSQQDVRELPFASGAFDLVICLEVLEHLDEPAAALSELSRVSRRDLVISVPHEPWFRIGSLIRGKHLSRLGNHPEHLQQWSRRKLEAFLAPRVEVVSLTGSFPWQIAHCRSRSDPV